MAGLWVCHCHTWSDLVWGPLPHVLRYTDYYLLAARARRAGRSKLSCALNAAVVSCIPGHEKARREPSFCLVTYLVIKLIQTGEKKINKAEKQNQQTTTTTRNHLKI